MRLLESAPERYDFGIRLLSLGHIDRVYRRVAELVRGHDVLDLGCGTGNLTMRLARLRIAGDLTVRHRHARSIEIHF